MWSNLKKLHWPEVTPIHHILKSNFRRSKFPTAWLNMREQVLKCLTNRFVPCKGIRILESGKFLLLESKIRESKILLVVYGIPGVGIQNRAQVHRTASYYFRAREAVFKLRGPIYLLWSEVRWGAGCGAVDFKNGLPGADSIFFNTVTTHQSFF